MSRFYIGLEYICKRLNIKYIELARRLGITPQTINNYLRGKRNISDKMLVRLVEEVEEFKKIPKDFFALDMNMPENKLLVDDVLVSNEAEKEKQSKLSELIALENKERRFQLLRELYKYMTNSESGQMFEEIIRQVVLTANDDSVNLTAIRTFLKSFDEDLVESIDIKKKDSDKLTVEETYIRAFATAKQLFYENYLAEKRDEEIEEKNIELMMDEGVQVAKRDRYVEIPVIIEEVVSKLDKKDGSKLIGTSKDSLKND